MKFRQGFVSNSSSSSFILRLPSQFDTLNKMWEVRIITPEEERLALEFGFKPTNLYHASALEVGGFEEDPPDNPGQLGYSVICNEDDVIGFLVKNKIPFEACIHYGHMGAFYDRGASEILWFRNFGLEHEMYGGKVEALTGRLQPASWRQPIEEYYEEDDK